MRTVYSFIFLLTAGLFFSVTAFAQQTVSGSTVVDGSAAVKGKTINKNVRVTVYPIPVTGSIINLAFENEPQGKYSLRLIDQGGNTIFSNTLITATGNEVKTLNLDAKPAPGIYVLSISGPGGFKERDGVIVE